MAPDPRHPAAAPTAPARPGRSRLAAARAFLSTPVDIGFLVLFRIAFGLLLALDMVWHFQHGHITHHFITPVFHFTYYGFDWVAPWPGPWMYVHFAVVGLAALAIAAGWHYRIASAVFFLGFAQIFLIDQALHLNHNYLITLLGGLLLVLPAHRAASLDVRAGRVTRQTHAPAWTLWLLRGQIGIVYFYGGLAKIGPDWLRGEPMRLWLAGRADLPVIGPWLTTEFAPYFFSYGGLLFDLAIVPLLLWSRTRWFALALCVFFHTTNTILFDIGIFPWVMLAASFLYFPPAWFRRIGGTPPAGTPVTPPRPLTRTAFALLALYAAGQTLIPFRHVLYPGDANWTEEGHRFAWHMKLRSKQGWARFYLTDPATGRTVEEDVTRWLTPQQALRMPTRPDMILQIAHELARRHEAATGRRPAVHVHAHAVLNGRPPQRFIDPAVDLAATPRNLRHAPWIIPLTTPLPDRPAGRRTVPVIHPLRAPPERLLTNPATFAATLHRLHAQARDERARIDTLLETDYGIRPDRLYLADDQGILRLTLKPGASPDLPADATADDLAARYDFAPHRTFTSATHRTTYHDLVLRKHHLDQRLLLLPAPPADD